MKLCQICEILMKGYTRGDFFTVRFRTSFFQHTIFIFNAWIVEADTITSETSWTIIDMIDIRTAYNVYKCYYMIQKWPLLYIL